MYAMYRDIFMQYTVTPQLMKYSAYLNSTLHKFLLAGENLKNCGN